MQTHEKATDWAEWCVTALALLLILIAGMSR